MPIRPEDVDLSGFFDAHIHTAPDVRPRSLTDLDAACDAAEAGMAGVLVKSHVTCTADRAALAEQAVPGVRVIGALVLNREVGGINPSAVEAALNLGAREVWLPTFSARGRGFDPVGIVVVDEAGRLLPPVLEVLRLVAESDVALGTGHLSVPEIVTVVREARRLGLKKIVVTHPDSAVVAMPVAVQREIAGPGVWFERCYIAALEPRPSATLAELAQRIRALGPASTVISTDLGQVGNPRPVDGFRAYVSGLLSEGLTQEEIRLMGAENPRVLFGI